MRLFTARATGGENVTPDHILSVYSRLGWVVIGAGVVVILLSRGVSRLMHLESIGGAAVDHALPGEAELAEPQAPGFPVRG